MTDGSNSIWTDSAFPPAYPQTTEVTPFSVLNKACVHQKHPPAKGCCFFDLLCPYNYFTSFVECGSLQNLNLQKPFSAD